MLSPVSRAWVLTAASLLCVVCIVVLSNLPQPRVIEAAQSPADLEASFILWGTGGGARLGFALGFDYLFMAAYVTAIGLGCAAVAEGARGVLRSLGVFLAYAQIASGLIDATENAALIRLLLVGFDERLMTVARMATASKFAIPVTGMAYIAVAWSVNRWWRR